MGNNTWEVCGQPVACPGHELSGLAVHLPGGAEACSQGSDSQCTHRIDHWAMQKEGSLFVFPIPRDLAGVLASPLEMTKFLASLSFLRRAVLKRETCYPL